jgi:anti-sigma regulatory factor (Ser/Thr protein kinase)
MCQHAHRHFTAVATPTARAARYFAITAIRDTLGSEIPVVEDAELITGELVANAVNAGAGSIEVHLNMHYDRVEIAVTDDGSGRPILQPPDLHATSGRGLQIVAALAASWGVTSGRDQRTTVRAQLLCSPLHTTTLTCSARPAPPLRRTPT